MLPFLDRCMIFCYNLKKGANMDTKEIIINYVKLGEIKYEYDENGDFKTEIKISCFIDREKMEEFLDKIENILKEYTI